MMSPRYSLLLILATIALTGCGKETLVLKSFDGTKTATFSVEVARTDEQREQGLMNRKSLPEGQGMLFALPEEQILQFWMKHTLVPLDILFFDKNGDFVSAASMDPCEKEPCTIYRSASLSKYALEVPKGTREKLGIGVGWKMDMEGMSSL